MNGRVQWFQVGPNFIDTIQVEYFLEPDGNVTFGEPPQRVHFLTGIAGASFDESMAVKW